MAEGARNAPRPRVAGLYAITPDEPDTGRLVTLVEAALSGGARWIQYRNKRVAEPVRKEQARALQAACSSTGAHLIINDHVGLALEVDAAGVHLGATDGDVRAARRALGASRVLGVSCYGNLALAQDAERAGADYVAFGSLYASPTKPHAARASLALFDAARSAGIGIALVGIGGITMHNIHELIAAHADAAAIIAAVFEDGHPDRVRERAEAFARCFLRGRTDPLPDTR